MNDYDCRLINRFRFCLVSLCSLWQIISSLSCGACINAEASMDVRNESEPRPAATWEGRMRQIANCELPSEQAMCHSGEHPVHGSCEVNGSAGRSKWTQWRAPGRAGAGWCSYLANSAKETVSPAPTRSVGASLLCPLIRLEWPCPPQPSLPRLGALAASSSSTPTRSSG